MPMGYTGPPALTLSTAFTEWTADVPVIVLVVVLGAAYLAGMRRARRAGRPWPAGRAIAFCGLGLGFLVYATMSWIGVYQGVLFYARATQTVLLVLVVPLFLAMGRPLTLLSAAAPAAGRRVEKIVRSKLAVALTFPAVPTFALVAVPFVMYFTTWYTGAFHSDAIRELSYLALMASGYLYFWTFLRVDPVPKEYNRAISMWITAAQVVGDAFFGIAVIADQNLIALHYYQALHRPFGPTFATDQVLGGGVLWILGDFVGLPFLAAQFIHAMREDKAEAAVIDAELDARDASVAATRQEAREAAREAARQVTGRDPDPAVDALADEVEEAADRLWWQDDPRFTDRFRPSSLCPSVVAPDAEGPPGLVVLAERERVRLHGAPGGDVGVGGGIVGQHGDDRADRHGADLLGQHDDGDGALAAQGVDDDQRLRHSGRGRGRVRGRRDGSPRFPAAEPLPPHQSPQLCLVVTPTFSIVPGP